MCIVLHYSEITGGSLIVAVRTSTAEIISAGLVGCELVLEVIKVY